MGVKQQTIVLAAGGTGGHVFPALALAEKLNSLGCDVWMLTDPRGRKLVPNLPWLTVQVVRAGTLRKHPVRFFTDIFDMIVGIFQSLGWLMHIKPDSVVGFGGYPCFPPVFAATVLRIPTLLHEGNALIGKANAFLAKFCTQLALSWPDYTGINEKTRRKTVVTGLPLRAEISARAGTPLPPWPGPRFNILIVGGSLGASVFARVIPAAMKLLSPEERKVLHLIQQVRTDDRTKVEQIYTAEGVSAELAPFFPDMPERLAACHLFIGRSGASTVAEVSTIRRPAIYVPAPYHADNQQLKNAQIVVKVGGAVVLPESDFTPERMVAEVRHFVHNPGVLNNMANITQTAVSSHATQRLADAVLALART